jgi:hypothetical protein
MDEANLCGLRRPASRLIRISQSEARVAVGYFICTKCGHTLIGEE